MTETKKLGPGPRCGYCGAPAVLTPQPKGLPSIYLVHVHEDWCPHKKDDLV
jgi:hypothetical protein